MALGLLLRVSWICFLLFGCSSGIPAIKGYGYPYKADTRNIGDDADDEALMFDDSTWQDSYNQPTVSNYKPSAAQWPGSIASPQSQPNNPSAPEVERPVNGGSGNWGLNKPENLLISPIYQPNVPVKPQPGPAKPQSAASTNRMPASPAGSAHFARPAAHESAPSSSFLSRKPEPVRNAYGVTGTYGPGSRNQDLNSGSSGSGSSTFQYPSENTGPSSTAGVYRQANYVTQPAKPQLPASANRMPAYPAGVSTHFARPTAHESAPSSGFVSGKPEPVRSGYGVAGASGFGSPNSGSSGSGASHFPRLVYEEVFQYPSENTGPSSTAEGYNQANYMRPPAKPQSAASTNRMPAFSAGVSTHFARPTARESAPSNFASSNTAGRYSQANYRRPSSPSYRNVGTGFTSQLPQKPADGTKKVAQKVSEPRNPQILPRSTYIVQSGNGYQRVRYLQTASRYTQPTRPLIMMPIRSKAVKVQPAAPKGVKNPQRTKW